jgi:RimJ/RimL family protein N-acetyltransferase
VDGRRLTARLDLVPITRADADQLWRLHQDPGIARWYGWNLNEARDFAEAMERGWQEDGVGKWLAHSRSDGTLIGRGGCSLATVEGNREVEIGWAVRERYWGQGYATEIGQAGLAFAFEALHADRIVAFTEKHNLRSRAVMERLGMRHVHDFNHPGLIEGSEGIHDDAVFVLYEIGPCG